MKPIKKVKKRTVGVAGEEYSYNKYYYYCGKCGKHLQEHWKFCPFCAEPIEMEKKHGK